MKTRRAAAASFVALAALAALAPATRAQSKNAAPVRITCCCL